MKVELPDLLFFALIKNLFLLGLNGTIKYSINNSDIFSVDESNGEISLKVDLDRETRDVYGLQIKATDGGGLESTSTLTVLVTDVNDNSPVFDRSYLIIDALGDYTKARTT